MTALSLVLVACANNKTHEGTIGTKTEKFSPFNPDSRLAKERTVYFDYNRYDVSPAFFDILKLHARYLSTHPQQEVRLEGNTDARGSSEYNLALGQRRSVAVSHILQQYGARRTQLEAISYGKERPTSYGHTEADYALNRRTDIQYIEK